MIIHHKNKTFTIEPQRVQSLQIKEHGINYLLEIAYFDGFKFQFEFSDLSLAKQYKNIISPYNIEATNE